MKKNISLLFLVLFQFIFSQNLQIERNNLDKAHLSKSFAVSHLESFEKKKVTKPILLGFKAMAYMVMADHAINPFKKTSYFKKGKKLLDYSISKAPNDIELRYMRLMVQENAPKIAGYYKNIKADKKFIFENLKHVNDKELRKIIIEYKNQQN